MSTPESEQVLTLLKELSVLKELDSERGYGSNPESERDTQRLRQERHQEIVAEIKAVAEEKRNRA